jgi:tyrosyl-tRNA synthetase
MFGKLMSISDDLMWRYFDLLSFRSNAELSALRAEVESGRNPMEAKFELAGEITARFHGGDAAKRARENFAARSQQREIPTDIPKRTETIDAAEIGIAALLKQCGLVPSTSQAFRLIEQGGIRLNNERVTNIKATVSAGATYLFQVGKRAFAEITVTQKTD